MVRVPLRIKNLLTIAALSVALILPASISAQGNLEEGISSSKNELTSGKKRHPWFKWRRHRRRHRRGPCDIPEFSADAASGSVALLIGGSLILMGRRRKEEEI